MLRNLPPQLLPLILGGLLAWSGGVKLPRRRAARQAAGSALDRILPSPAMAANALRAVGAIEVALAVTLLVWPLSPVGAFGTAALGVCFVGYLGYAKATAPESSCGCTSRDTPITWRAFTRAGLIAVGGAACALARAPWWSAVAHHPGASAAVVAALVVALGVVSSDLDHLWLVPLRRMRLRLFGHPLAGTTGDVPVAATEELLEGSLAWLAAKPIVRSALIEHWDSDGWRIMRYSGVNDGPDGPQPVSVVFALDGQATTDTAANPVVRVSVIDEESGQVVADPAFEVLPAAQQEYASETTVGG